jgi:hypothetical protein
MSVLGGICWVDGFIMILHIHLILLAGLLELFDQFPFFREVLDARG